MEAIKNINNEEAPIPAQHHHMEKDDQATVASHGTHRSNRSYGSRRSRGYPTGAGDSSKRWRRDDDTTTHYSRDRSQSQDPNASWRPSRSRDRSNSHPRDYYKGDNNNSNRTEHDTASTTQPDARERYQRSESCAPVAERAYTRDSTSVNHADFRRGRSSSVTSSRSEPPFKTGRRFRTGNSVPGRRFDSISQSRSPGRMMRPGPSLPKEGIEWPPCFESEGSAFIFHPASGMFYEQESDFFYDPKAKMYYGVRKGAYFRYDESQDPPFVETQRMDPTQGTPVTPVEPPVTLPPVNAPSQNLIAKPKIAIKLKTKKIKKLSDKVAAINNDSSQASDTSSLIPSMASKLHKEQVANMQKWKEKQAELQSLHSVSSSSGGGGVSAAAAAEEIKRTTKGEPICVICKRKFPTIDKLRLHEEKSELHKSNLAKAEQEQQQQQQQQRGESSSPRSSSSSSTSGRQHQSDGAGAVDYYSYLRPILLGHAQQEDDHLVDESHRYQQQDPHQHPPSGQLCICLLFNLAIANHSKALLLSSSRDDTNSGNSSTNQANADRSNESTATTSTAVKKRETRMALQEAINLYRIAYSLQANERMELSRLHTFGIVNNLGQLYHEVGMDTESKSCFDLLLQMISADQRARMQRTTRMVLDQDWTMLPSATTSSTTRSGSLFTGTEDDYYGGSSAVGDSDHHAQQQQQQENDYEVLELFQDNIFVALVGHDDRYFHCSPAA